MKKVFPFLLLTLLLMPTLIIADIAPLVPCGRPGQSRCELTDIFTLALNIYKFIVFYIATPLAGLIIIIGGVIIMVSGGPGQSNPVTNIASPNMYNTGKNMVTGAIFGIFLIWGSWLIINSVCWALGVTCL